MSFSLIVTWSIGRIRKRHTFLPLLLCLILVITIHPGTNALASQPAQFRTYLRQGIMKAFNLENQSAMDFFRKAVELDREEPLGYAFMALARLFSYEMSFDPLERTNNQEAMLKAVDDTLSRGQKRIEENAKDGQAYFAMSLAKIVKIRWAITQKRYVAMVQEATNIWFYIEKAAAEDPQNHDIYFPMGVLHYHLDHLPGVARFFSTLLITAADHEKGLRELELAAQKGDLLKELAMAELSSVYIYFEKKPAQSLPITLELKDKFPRNYSFLFALANTFSELDRFTEAFTVAGEIGEGIKTGKAPFVPQLQPRHDHLLGRILFNQGEYAKAIDYFQKALADTSVYNTRTRTSALVRLGMIHDVRKERKRAEEYYSRALAVEGGEGIAHVEARKYLKNPYVPRSDPSSLNTIGP